MTNNLDNLTASAVDAFVDLFRQTERAAKAVLILSGNKPTDLPLDAIIEAQRIAGGVLLAKSKAVAAQIVAKTLPTVFTNADGQPFMINGTTVERLDLQPKPTEAATEVSGATEAGAAYGGHFRGHRTTSRSKKHHIVDLSHANAMMPWSDELIADVCNDFIRGKSPEWIGEHYGRSTGSILNKLWAVETGRLDCPPGVNLNRLIATRNALRKKNHEEKRVKLSIAKRARDARERAGRMTASLGSIGVQ